MPKAAAAAVASAVQFCQCSRTAGSPATCRAHPARAQRDLEVGTDGALWGAVQIGRAARAALLWGPRASALWPSLLRWLCSAQASPSLQQEVDKLQSGQRHY
eukprot:349855-Chlamydomonas_euryale.AAC.7